MREGQAQAGADAEHFRQEKLSKPGKSEPGGLGGGRDGCPLLIRAKGPIHTRPGHRPCDRSSTWLGSPSGVVWKVRKATRSL
jgi:hypothetical protein